jgi:hypothetical protein
VEDYSRGSRSAKIFCVKATAKATASYGDGAKRCKDTKWIKMDI